jgi:hypothetical protein
MHAGGTRAIALRSAVLTQVCKDVRSSLRMPNATLQTSCFNRANIHFFVRGKWTSAQPLKQLAKCAAAACSRAGYIGHIRMCVFARTRACIRLCVLAYVSACARACVRVFVRVRARLRCVERRLCSGISWSPVVRFVHEHFGATQSGVIYCMVPPNPLKDTPVLKDRRLATRHRPYPPPSVSRSHVSVGVGIRGAAVRARRLARRSRTCAARSPMRASARRRTMRG